MKRLTIIGGGALTGRKLGEDFNLLLLASDYLAERDKPKELAALLGKLTGIAATMFIGPLGMRAANDVTCSLVLPAAPALPGKRPRRPPPRPRAEQVPKANQRLHLIE